MFALVIKGSSPDKVEQIESQFLQCWFRKKHWYNAELMQLPKGIKGLFLSCVQKFLLNELTNRSKLNPIKSSTNNLQLETRQMPLSSKSDNTPVPGVLVRLRCIQMHQKPARIHLTFSAWPWPLGYHLRLVFHNNKNPKYQVWQRSECFFREEGEEKEKHTTKPAKKTKVKDMAKKWKGETTRRKGMDIGKGTEEKEQDVDRALHWVLICCNQEFPLRKITY